MRIQKKLNMDFDKVDMLIHSAGIISVGSLEVSSVADFDKQYKINVRAPFLLTQALLPMLRSGKGQIVFINSSAGVNASANIGPYAATKHALKAIAESLRQEVNEQGIRVFSIFPGRTATPMQAEVHEREGKIYHPERLLQPEDVAKIVLQALSLSRTAEVTDVDIRPMLKP
jgi:NADP-dependent 3-hydroxy acid dehydrogenase YdfG